MKKIVIVGGGTAGWLAGFVLSKIYKNNVTVIDSSKIGIIGVGEGGTHVIGTLITTKNNFGFNIRDFMIATDATFKLGVHHKGWPNEYYIPLDLLPDNDSEDFLPLKIAQGKEIHTISEIGLFIEEDRIPIRSDEIGTWETSPYSFHFDGHKVGQFFKEKCIDVVEHIDSVVQQINLDETGSIKNLILENNIIITADLFIDCTGFEKILMTALGNKWVSYKKHLLMNSAVPFRVPHFDLGAFTRAQALQSGWTWSIPTIKNQGMGYVFCDQFTSYEAAIKELEDTYKKEINPVKHIKFDPGRLDKVWLKNCVALGLASAFVEPLEATSIHATKIQLDEIGKLLSQETQDIDLYNKNICSLYDDIKDFIVLHYLGGRKDSEFWKYCSTGEISTDRVTEILEISKHRLLTEKDIPNPYNSLSYRAWNQVLAGLGKFSKEAALQSLTAKTEERYNAWYNSLMIQMKEYKTLEEVTKHKHDWWL